MCPPADISFAPAAVPVSAPAASVVAFSPAEPVPSPINCDPASAGFRIVPALEARITLLAEKLRARGWMCVTAESCTGGLVGASLTAVSGSSSWFAGGVISYANEVKTGLLGVDAAVLAANGAVSKPVVRQMAAGVCRLTGARAAMSISGVAGPGGGTAEKPVGTVWFGWAVDGVVTARKLWIPATRPVIRQIAVGIAVNGLLEAMDTRAAQEARQLSKFGR